MNLLEALRQFDKIRRPLWPSATYLTIKNGVLKMVSPLWEKPRAVTLLRADVFAEDFEEYSSDN